MGVIMKRKMKFIGIAIIVAVAGAAVYLSGYYASFTGIDVAMISQAHAVEKSLQQGGDAVQKGVYFPNTETLAPDEMRVISLGTGLPTPLTKAQKSTSWMVELGNGDVFLFDVGTGSVENLFAIQPQFSKVDKAFVSHLHTDHVGDL
jgi:hypothetical protein